MENQLYLIDSHTHLTDKGYRNQLELLFDRSRQAGVKQWITIGTNVQDSRAAIELTKQFENLYCTAGVHPHNAAKESSDFRSQLNEMAGDEKVCAIGEIGLDYHYEFSDRKSQKRILAEQLDLAKVMDLPVVFHCREAFEDSLGILGEQQYQDHRVVFHCFGGSVEQTRQVLDRGFSVSFTGTITFGNAGALTDTVRYVPLDRIMLETDCPYLSPEPHRKVKPNEPALLVHVARKLAQLKDETIEKVTQVTTDNCRLFFQLDKIATL